MAFIDNSKDIIIDAVLTDLGRKRMAEGRFNISRFALGDDEINYGLYNGNHSQGEPYYDLELLQTPVFEAFTNNISNMNSRLVSYTLNNILYLPVLKLNETGTNIKSTLVGGQTYIHGGTEKTDIANLSNVFLVAVDETTRTALYTANKKFIDGSKEAGPTTNYIRVDQGIDNSAQSNTEKIFTELKEEQYTLEIDNRFGFISFNDFKIQPTFIDDDYVALYTFNISDPDRQMVVDLAEYNTSTPGNTNQAHVLAGSRGTALRFGIYANNQLATSDTYWFDTFGSTINIGLTGTWKIIHTTATVTGLRTGYSIDIPVSFIRKTA